MLQAAKQELTRQFNAAERERKSRKKLAAEAAHQKRDLEIRKKQKVKVMRLYVHSKVQMCIISKGPYKQQQSFAMSMYLISRNDCNDYMSIVVQGCALSDNKQCY